MKLVLVILTLSFCCISALLSSDCASEYSISLPLTKLGSKRYYIELNTRANWFGAMTFCHSHKMHLANILSEAENFDLGQHIGGLGLGQRLWTSGTDLTSKGKWVWTGAGTRMVYKNWGAGQPDNHGSYEHCLDVRMVDNVLVWNDNSCSVELHFICEPYNI